MNIAAKRTEPDYRPTRTSSAPPGVAAVRDGAQSSPAAGGPPASGAVTLFDVRFATGMSESDVALLARELDLCANLRSEATPGTDNLGFARLDHSSGLFLKPGMVDGQWILRAQTWGRPAPRTVHGWHVLAAAAVRRLDPTVSVPDRPPDEAPQIPDRRVGRAANKRLTRIRRRLVGLS